MCSIKIIYFGNLILIEDLFVLVVILVLSMVLLSMQSPMETLDELLVNPVEPALVSLLVIPISHLM